MAWTHSSDAPNSQLSLTRPGSLTPSHRLLYKQRGPVSVDREVGLLAELQLQ